jgi:predicted RNase H-like nuclease (RuvC/YqgF family)
MITDKVSLREKLIDSKAANDNLRNKNKHLNDRLKNYEGEKKILISKLRQIANKLEKDSWVGQDGKNGAS